MESDSGRCLAARATHASHRARILGLGLSVGIAIALSGCSVCDDPGGLAIAKSMREHPNEWQWDGYFFTNNKHGVLLWNNDLWVLMPPHPFTTMGCRAMINENAEPIRNAHRRALRADFVARLR